MRYGDRLDATGTVSQTDDPARRFADRAAVRRTAAICAALAALLLAARGGQSRAVALTALLGYVAVAAVWLRGQYADALAGRPWLLRRAIAAVSAGLGAACGAVFFTTRADGLGVIGLVLVYLAVGAAVATWRETGRGEGQWPIGLLVSGAAIAGLGLVLLGRAPEWASLGALGIAALVLLPMGLTLVSERAVRALAGCSAGRRRALGGAGLAAFAGASVAATALARSWWLLLVMAAVALAMLAIASSTQADIAVIIAVLSLMGTTPHQARLPDAAGPAADGTRELVAIGDSYMSGEGAAVYYSGTDDGGGNQCRRSPTAWAALAGQQDPFDRLVYLACSGARTANVRAGDAVKPLPEGQAGEPGTQLAQWARLAGGRPAPVPDLVVVNVGGNDAGFSAIGLMCLAPGNCDRREKQWTDALPQLRVQLDATYAEIDAAFPDSPVVVTAYPRPIADGACGQLPISASERRFIGRFVDELNDAVRDTAAAHRFHFLEGMQDSLADARLQLCDPLNDGRPGLNFIGLRSVNGIAEQRFHPKNWAHSSLHPNERGHAAMFRTFERWLAEQGRPERRVGDGGPAEAAAEGKALPSGDAAVPAPPCQLFSDGVDGCRPQASRWAQRRAAETAVTHGLVLLVAAAGAWAAAVALLGWRRRDWQDHH